MTTDSTLNEIREVLGKHAVLPTDDFMTDLEQVIDDACYEANQDGYFEGQNNCHCDLDDLT